MLVFSVLRRRKYILTIFDCWGSTVRKTLMLSFTALISLATPSFAAPAIIASDVDTGIILSSNNIDKKQTPQLAAKLTIIFVALNDIVTGSLDPDAIILKNDSSKVPLYNVLHDAASTSQTSMQSLALLSTQIAPSPGLMGERFLSLFKQVGMRATLIDSQEAASRITEWGGYTTTRDLARLTSAMMLTHGAYMKSVFPIVEADLIDSKDDGVWMYFDGACISVSEGFSTKRRIVTVIQGASSEKNCLGASRVAVNHNDRRIEAVSGSNR